MDNRWQIFLSKLLPFEIFISSVQVARLLMDTSVMEFYPTLFVLATDVMDMLGHLVWERIRQKAEYSEDGTIICSLPGLTMTFIIHCLSFSCTSTPNFWSSFTELHIPLHPHTLIYCRRSIYFLVWTHWEVFQIQYDIYLNLYVICGRSFWSQ